jgi:xanthine dehydrogenase accessory factor
MTREILNRLLAEIAAKRSAVLATDLASGDARLLDPFGEAAGAGAALARAAREAAERDQSAKVETPEGAVFLRVFNPPVQVVVVGAVHIAQALAPMVRLAGYDVIVVDPRRAFATEDRFRGIPLAVEWPDEALARIGVGRRTAVVTMTHDPKIDDPALSAALRAGAFYVGALGSRKTQAARRDRLRAAGLSEADLARIHGPVGLAIGAASPGEIAVSILGEIVAALRRAGASAAGERAGAQAGAPA